MGMSDAVYAAFATAGAPAIKAIVKLASTPSFTPAFLDCVDRVLVADKALDVSRVIGIIVAGATAASCAALCPTFDVSTT